MPDFHNPRFVHVSGGSGGGGIAAAVAVVVAVAAGAAVLGWIGTHAAGIEEIVYTAIGVIVTASIVLVAIVLRREFRSTRTGIDYRQLAALKAGRAAAVASPALVAAVTAAEQRQAIEVHHHYGEQHLHLHGISTADVAAAIASRQEPPGQLPKAWAITGADQTEALRPAQRRLAEED